MSVIYDNYIYPIVDITTGGNVFDNICASVYGKGPILNRKLCELKKL
jgi:hypothetical protein